MAIDEIHPGTKIMIKQFKALDAREAIVADNKDGKYLIAWWSTPSCISIEYIRENPSILRITTTRRGTHHMSYPSTTQVYTVFRQTPTRIEEGRRDDYQKFFSSLEDLLTSSRIKAI